MKVGIDGSRLRAGATGIGRYTARILEALDKAMPHSTFVLYARSDCDFSLPSGRWLIRCDTHPIWSRLPTTYWIHYRLGSLARLDGLDVFWAPNTLMPACHATEIPCVITVADFQHLLGPENVPLLTRLVYRRWFDADLLRASRVVTISEGTSQRMKSVSNRLPDAIAYPAVPLRAPVVDRASAARELAVHGVRQPFLLTVGDRPCKNLVGAVEAVALLKAGGNLVAHQLVMVGPRTWGKHYGFTRQTAANDWVTTLGHVSDVTLTALYSLADALIFPSFYEGFGIPVLEARALGCRVVATDIPELREAGGNDAVYVEPTADRIAAGLESVLLRPQPPMRKLMRDWSDAAKVMADVLRGAAAVGKEA